MKEVSEKIGYFLKFMNWLKTLNLSDLGHLRVTLECFGEKEYICSVLGKDKNVLYI